MALIADAHPSVAHCPGYTAHPSYHLPRKANSIHHHQCPRRFLSSLSRLFLPESPMSKDERVTTHLGTDVFSATKRPSQIICVACHQEVHRWRVPWRCDFPSISPSIIFSGHHRANNTTILWLQQMPPWATTGQLEEASKLWPWVRDIFVSS